jgi:hypothetical protein
MKIDKIVHYGYTKLLILLWKIHSEIFDVPGGFTPAAGATPGCDVSGLPGRVMQRNYHAPPLPTGLTQKGARLVVKRVFQQDIIFP